MKSVTKTQMFQDIFLNGSSEGLLSYEKAVNEAKNEIMAYIGHTSRPYSGLYPETIEKMFKDLHVCPDEGHSLEEVLKKVRDKVLEHSVKVSDPRCTAHLHCPVTIPSLAAEMLISVTNQSLDSWDQSPAATYLEEAMVRWLCSRFGYSDNYDGVFTSGGSQSNYTGLMLARDHYCQTKLNWNVQRHGLPPEGSKLKVLCSQYSHFTVSQSAAQLGLGGEAVVPVKTDECYRMSATDLRKKIEHLQQQNFHPFAIIGTAGTTDFGSIDPLFELAIEAERNDIWLHVDAAYGGALILSDTYCYKLNGIEQADSLAVDFHKLFYQPISCGAFLLKNGHHFNLMKRHADYLNPEEDEADGIINLVSKSIQTTRRFDALKLYISMQTLGKKTFADMIHHTIQLAQEMAGMIVSDPNLEMLNEPELSTVVFRYCPVYTQDANQINAAIQNSLLYSGQAVVAKTKVDENIYLKLTILNPRLTIETISQILTDINSWGKKLENKEERGGSYEFM